MLLKGAYTAIITPFTNKGELDYKKYIDLINMQLKNGIDGIVPAGTTGESPTLSMDEHRRLIDVTVETVAGKAQVIAGTGGNSTSEAIELTKHAISAGVDATLQVTPYYNKPNQEGLYAHFSTVADLGLPVVLYNVPGRASKEIEISIVEKLSKHPNIIGIKEAGGSVDRVSKIMDVCDISVVSGDDPLTLPMMVVGAKGVISVASNFMPKEVTKMVHLALSSEWEKARKLHAKYHKLFNDMFMDTNPIPVKTAMAILGLIKDNFRLPMCRISEEKKKLLRASLKKAGFTRNSIQR